MITAIDKIEKLVGMVADDLLQASTSKDERVEGLRVLHPYYSALKKASKGVEESEDDGITMGDLRGDLHRVEIADAQRAVSSHRGRRARRNGAAAEQPDT
jgi:hypothetical protein